jgi:hypothetical protein
VQAINGGSLELNNSWDNTGILLVTNSGTLWLQGSFTLADVGTLKETNGTIYLSGTLTNTGTLTLDAASGSWVLNGGQYLAAASQQLVGVPSSRKAGRWTG